MITARITAAFGGDAVLAGVTAGAMAAALRRALTRASGWRDHDWRFIRAEPQDPALHMALDEVLVWQVAAGRRRRRCGSGNGRRPRSSSAASSRCATRSTRRRRAGSA